MKGSFLMDTELKMTTGKTVDLRIFIKGRKFIITDAQILDVIPGEFKSLTPDSVSNDEIIITADSLVSILP